jgi:hypothetical protein
MFSPTLIALAWSPDSLVLQAGTERRQPMRLTTHQRTAIFQAMLAEARQKTAKGLTGQDIVRAAEHVKRDLLTAHRQGFTITPVPAQYSSVYVQADKQQHC